MAQNLQEGFTKLESGLYEEAIDFFKTAVQEYPDNKYANIGLGRSVGLGGNSEAALSIFEGMLLQFPTDEEVLLNLAEAYLWDKQADNAIEVYQDIFSENEGNKTVLIGLANSYAQKGQYTTSFNYIQRALKAYPEDTYIQRSYMDIGLALAYYSRLDGDFQKSITVLNALESRSIPHENLYLSIAENYLLLDKVNLSQDYYIKALNYNKAPAFLGLANIASQKGKLNKTISLADSVLVLANQKSDLSLAAKKIKWQSLFLQGKGTEALNLESNIKENHCCELPFQLAEIDFLLMNRQEKKAIAKVQSLQKTSKKNLSTSLTAVRSYFANKNYIPAERLLDSLLEALPRDKQVLLLKKQLDRIAKPEITLTAFTSEDGGGFENDGTQIKAVIPLQYINRFSIGYALSNIGRVNEVDEVRTNAFSFGFERDLSLRSKFQLGASLHTLNESNDSPLLVLPNFRWDQRFLKWHTISPFVRTQVETYNSELARTRLSYTQLGTNYLFAKPGKMALYLELQQAIYSDENQRSLLYAAVFKDLSLHPQFRIGLNYNFISFAIDRNTLYFSPIIYHHPSVFFQLRNEDFIQKGIIYDGLLSFGLQKIGADDLQSTRRVEVKLGYKFNPGQRIFIQYLDSNAAQATNNGSYSYSRILISAILNLG